MTGQVEPRVVLERVLRIYREQAVVLLPMSLAVALPAATLMWPVLYLAPDVVIADARPQRPSTVGVIVWTVVLALLVRCVWVTARRLRAARKTAKAGAA